jgi:hypothetical protein
MSYALSSCTGTKAVLVGPYGSGWWARREGLHAPGSISGSAIRSLIQRMPRSDRTRPVPWWRY